MNYDEFAFLNQQLAAMLRDGIPLEGALKQLAAGMGDGPLRAEIQKLEGQLVEGVSLEQALAKAQVPEFYRRMVNIGARSNDLPGVLTLLADHYHRVNALWTRLKGLMVYPMIVVIISLALTASLSFLFSHYLAGVFEQFPPPVGVIASLWVPPIALGLLVLLAIGIVSLPKWRARLRWRLPAFREASLAQIASAISMMLRKGVPLADALALAETLESNSPAAGALSRWRGMVEAGQGKPAQWPSATKPFPPLFLWLVQKGGEDAAAGFDKAAEIYRSRANYRIEMALYGALPISILFLGQMIVWQVAPLVHAMSTMMNALGNPGG